MAKRRRRRRIKWKRILFMIIVFIALLFGLYKGVTIGINQIVSYFKPTEETKSEEVIEEVKPIATVVIDPGHGGADGGALSGSLVEKDITLKTANFIKTYLEKLNVEVVLTRTNDDSLDEDKFTDLAKRAAISESSNASYFVSIHVNGFEGSSTVTGHEIYTKNSESRSLATAIRNQLKALNYTNDRGINDGGDLRVLRLNTVPSVLVEIGYIRGNDKKYLADDSYLEIIGNAIGEGVYNQVKES